MLGLMRVPSGSFFRSLTLLASCVLIAASLPSAEIPRQGQTRNVVLVTLDGVRWQEVFSGADSAILADTTRTPRRASTAMREALWRESAEERRMALFPFLWGTVAVQGQVFGGPGTAGARLTNGLRFSYPGYHEMLAGFPDPRIDANDHGPNPNVTVFEWLHREREFRGRVAAVATWDVFRDIFNAERSGILVNAAWAPLELPRPGERQRQLNELNARLPRPFGDGERFDALAFAAAREVLVRVRPRLLFLGLGETDDWAHQGRYDWHLEAARRADEMIGSLWALLDSLPEYRGRTTLIITTDHGRGATAATFPNHGRRVEEADEVWIAMLGPDTPARGRRTDAPAVTLAQVAATIASALGRDWPDAEPRAAPPLPGTLR